MKLKSDLTKVGVFYPLEHSQEQVLQLQKSLDLNWWVQWMSIKLEDLNTIRGENDLCQVA
jgi:hypothetical protein